jgi:nickel-type superoxide dismutase maturation protease
MRIAKLLVGSGFLATLVTAAATRLTRVTVTGDSMRPALEPGDRLVVRRTRRPHVGDVIALHDPRDERRVLVKRVGELGEGRFVVLGDNAGASTDSRVFGPVPSAAVIGVAVYRYAPAHRSAMLGRRPVPCTEWPRTGSTPSSPPTTSRG